MKTKYKYIYFIKGEKALLDEVIWHCWNKKKTLLGSVVYCEQWHEWEFQPKPMMGFTIECLRDIADFLDQLNKEKT